LRLGGLYDGREQRLPIARWRRWLRVGAALGVLKEATAFGRTKPLRLATATIARLKLISALFASFVISLALAQIER
jgi:hypothetical protein